jgi:RNA polymerase sigma-70 factor (ECF subfamily)
MDFEIVLEGCKNGEKKAQGLLYQICYNSVYSTCKKYLTCGEESKDLTQDILLKIINKINKFNGNNKPQLDSWVKSTARNSTIDYIRGKKNNIEYFDSIANNETYEMFDDLFGNVDKKNMDDILLVINKLSKKYKKVFELYHLCNYTHDEISEELNISVGTSKSNLFKAKQNLVKYLNK